MNEWLCYPQLINFLEVHFLFLLSENEDVDVDGTTSNNDSSFGDFCAYDLM